MRRIFGIREPNIRELIAVPWLFSPKNMFPERGSTRRLFIFHWNQAEFTFIPRKNIFFMQGMFFLHKTHWAAGSNFTWLDILFAFWIFIVTMLSVLCDLVINSVAARQYLTVPDGIRYVPSFSLIFFTGSLLPYFFLCRPFVRVSGLFAD